MSNYLFSIITPCYNGSNTLRRTFDSLQKLTTGDINFEWILVDDHSNDNNKTIQLINDLCKEASFPTKTIFLTQNYYGSKSTFEGAKISDGEYIIVLDQDDMLMEDSLKIFQELISKYHYSNKFAGVCGRCIDMNNNLIGTKTDWQELLSNELEIRYFYKIRGEMFQCTKRELVIQYFSDFIPGLTNGYAWLRISRNYQYVYTNKIVRRYDTTNPFSYTNLKEVKHIDALIQMIKYNLENNYDYLNFDKVSFYREIMQLSRLSLHQGVSIKEILTSLPRQLHQLNLIIFPFGLLRYLIDNLFNRKYRNLKIKNNLANK